jgi:hypothetical protein
MSGWGNRSTDSDCHSNFCDLEKKYGRSEIVFTMSSHYVPAHYVTAQVNINLLPETRRVSNLEHINESCAVGEIPCFFQIYSLYS